MKIAVRPLNEEERIRSLYELDVLNKTSHASLDELTELASSICEAPISLVTLIDKERQFFKSKVGIDLWETPRDISFCAHAILEDDVTIIEDASLDERFHDNPLVTGPLHVRFYAGFPLKTMDSLSLGTLCVVDTKPRKLTPQQQKALKVLSNQASAHLELLRFNKKQHEKNQEMEAIFRNISLSIMTLNESGQITAEHGNQIQTMFGITNGKELLEHIDRNWSLQQAGLSLRRQIESCFIPETPLIGLQIDQLPRDMHFSINGEERAIELTWDPIWSPEHTLDRLVLSLKDVTQNLREQEQRLTLSENMAVIGELVNDLSYDLRSAQMVMQPDIDQERCCFRQLFESQGILPLWEQIERQLDNMPLTGNPSEISIDTFLALKDLSSEQKNIIQSLFALGFSAELAEQLCRQYINPEKQQNRLVGALLSLLQSIQAANKASQRIKNVADSILDHSKRVQGRGTFKLLPLITSNLLLLSKFANRANVTFEVDPSCDVLILANESDIHQIVLSISKNAIEAFEGTERSSTVKLVRFATEVVGNMIKLIIEDNAGGITDAVRDRLFEGRFTTKGSKGHGLGLYLSRRLAVRNKGTLDVQSRDGKTYFYLSLPYSAKQSEKAA